jgi:hypothetical protein
MKSKKENIDYSRWPRKTARIAELFLDPKNMRLSSPDELRQDAIINDLFVNENAMQILTSIAKNGFFPIELPVVVKEGGKLIVIEGNRRISAIKALLHPEIILSMEQKIKTILKTAVPIVEEINIVIAPDRDSAMILLADRHTQNTWRPWRPLRQAYFYMAELERGRTVKDLRNDYSNVDIDKFLRMFKMHKITKSIEYDNDVISLEVRNERRFPISTLERMYDDKNIQNFLGFDFGADAEVNIKIEKAEFEKGLKRLCRILLKRERTPVH